MCRTRGWGCGRIAGGLGSSEIRDSEIRDARTDSRFPEGMTERKTRATATATTGSFTSFRMTTKKKQRQQQIPGGNDRKKSKGKSQYRGLSTAHHKDRSVMLRSR